MRPARLAKALRGTSKQAVEHAARRSTPVLTRELNDSAAPDALGETDTDFILSILRSSPSKRDSRAYMASFAPPTPPPSDALADPNTNAAASTSTSAAHSGDSNVLVSSLLNPILRRPALVKIQGPFSDAQLSSIAKGMAHLQKLGLVSVIVVDRDDLPVDQPEDGVAAQRQRMMVLRDVERVVAALGRSKAAARPVLATVARAAGPADTRLEGAGVEVVAGSSPSSAVRKEGDVFVEEEGLDHIRRAVAEGEIPVLLPVALDPECRSRRVGADKVLAALAEGMATSPTSPSPSSSGVAAGLDITPLRLLVINREGGIPSYARSGLPHLSINIASEYTFITDTFQSSWRSTHPTALANLTLARNCLEHMPPESSALIVSHRSPAAMIANLITNKPAHSASLPHALLAASEGRITRDTPTLLRKGLPVKVLREMSEVDKEKLTALLEKSFRRKLNQEAFYGRLDRDLDFVIVIGDYAGAAIVTRETPAATASSSSTSSASSSEKICYLDKFAVDPSNQGDGTVDFLWVALRDETYGLGLLDAANPSEGSLAGRGRGRDLVWRSRADNPVNKWYFERSSGFTTSADGKWKMFWCDAEQRLRETAREEGREFGGGRLVRVVEEEERGRLEGWAPAIEGIKSAWSD